MPDSLTQLSLPIQPLRLSGGTASMKAKIDSGQFASETTDPEALKKACSDLESLFIFQLFKEMRATIPKSGYLSGGKGEAMYTSMMDAQVAKELAAKRGIGLATLLERSLVENSASPDKKNVEK